VNDSPYKEQDQLFDFGPDWHVLKWDDGSEYRNGIGKLSGSKAVDFLAVFNGRLYLIEVKDGRKEEPQFRMRLKEDLFIEVGQKVRDSLAGLVGKLHMASKEELWGRFREAILRLPVTVVLWLELHHGPRGPSAVDELKAEAATREEQLRTRVHWLTRRTIVTSTRMGPRPDLPGLKVTNLAGAGQPNPQ
jgi:hypothetical protein